MSSLVSRIDQTVLSALAPKAPSSKLAKQQAIISALGKVLAQFLERFNVTTALRIRHFLAQVAHESDGFCTLTEYASGAAYEGRTDIGNTQKGDGPRYRGRALIQLTGRENYRKFTNWMRQRIPDAPDFEDNPELVATWPWAAWATFYYWSVNNLNFLADDDNLIGLTRRINGGTNGLKDREAYLSKSKQIISQLQIGLVSNQNGFALLSRGMTNIAVADLQTALKRAGFYFSTIDTIFGGATETAVRAFQRKYGLTDDGVVGTMTWAKLKPFMPEAGE